MYTMKAHEFFGYGWEMDKYITVRIEFIDALMLTEHEFITNWKRFVMN